MRKFIILGPVDPRSVVRTAVFRDVADGAVPEARYFGIDALLPGVRALDAALTSYRLKALMAKLPPLKPLLERARAAALHRAQRATLRRVGGGADCFIFCPSTHIERISPALLDDLRRKSPGCHLVFYLIDSVERTARINGLEASAVLDLLDRFDAVYTYDKTDAARYAAHMRYLDIPLWRAPGPAPTAPAFDLYFCGRDKGRGPLLVALHQRLARAGLRCKLRIAGETDVPALPGVERGGWTPYDQTVAELRRSNCVLEVLAAHNNECSLRYKEAVLYNRKLLTSNPNITALPYYDPRWMRTFQSAEDVDLDWLRAVEPVDYGYQGDYSVENFLRRVAELAAANDKRQER